MNKLRFIFTLTISLNSIKLSAQYYRNDYYTTISEGLGFINKDGLWGYIDEDGNEVIVPQYMFAYPFSDGVAKVTDKEGKTKFIDKKK